jgi:hypothetical protein
MKLTASPIPSLTPSPTNPQLFHSPIPYLSTSPVQYCPIIHTYIQYFHTYDSSYGQAPSASAPRYRLQSTRTRRRGGGFPPVFRPARPPHAKQLGPSICLISQRQQPNTGQSKPSHHAGPPPRNRIHQDRSKASSFPSFQLINSVIFLNGHVLLALLRI